VDKKEGAEGEIGYVKGRESWLLYFPLPPRVSSYATANLMTLKRFVCVYKRLLIVRRHSVANARMQLAACDLSVVNS